ncbi:hypothetical protein pgond44_08687 [Psychroflexus gondwanensis ACAM 44]|uniref:GLPGLI family protein n=1 Tax=Psychroflexus gondwanensis ACAM 44 TaxID=1189619 RepID=N1WV42_9FLAO|nr:GLPGLI family protein [Psychroflexus gondwanensis]EMY81072.1 hypothetical protein pgond44_08687 [Psychroflexus gondwanensis ACAM 44]
MTKHTINSSILLVLLFIGFNSQSQDINGKITYKGVVKQTFVDSAVAAIKKEKISMSYKKDIIYAMENAHPDEFVLSFKKDESYYYKEPTLEKNIDLMGSRAGSSPYYVNKTLNKTIQVSSVLGNIDKIPLEWEITNKTKKIGKYTCRQAKTTEKIYSRNGYFLYNKIIAWFAPDIPISFGPKNYNGLPGLILQIDYKEFTLTAIKINLNIKEKDLEIKRVDDIDKLVSEKESHKRIEEIMSDREKMYKN